jgi:hypothetical protein
MHPILDSLDGTPHEWIKKLLFTFNEGNIGKFEAQSPLFGQEVRHHPLEAGSKPRSDSGRTMVIAISADTPGKLSVPAAEDLPHGIDRVSLRAGCL